MVKRYLPVQWLLCCDGSSRWRNQCERQGCCSGHGRDSGGHLAGAAAGEASGVHACELQAHSR